MIDKYSGKTIVSPADSIQGLSSDGSGSPSGTIHPIGDGLTILPATTEPPTGAIGCSADRGDAFVDDKVFVLLDEIVAVECLDGEAGRALLRDGRQIALGYSAPAVLARLRGICRGKETGT